MKISAVKAIEVLDSRGKPTVRAFVTTEDGAVYSSSVPSGASTGSHEAVELRDADSTRYQGLGVLKAVEHVNTVIAKEITGLNVEDPAHIDERMIALDGTENKSKLGANAILAVSQAVVKSAAGAANIPLWKYIHDHYFPRDTVAFPRIMVNVVNGGKHAGWNFDIQEFMIVPGERTPSKSVRIAAEIFHQIGATLKKKGMSTLVGDEGGYSPALSSNEEVIQMIIENASVLSYQNKQDFQIALDAASSEFFQSGKYIFKKTGQSMTGQELQAYYEKLEKDYSILSFEDPFSEDDWDTFTSFTAASKNRYITVGDDLYVTNTKRIQKGIDMNATNAVLIKLNQIGSVKETVDAVAMSRQAGWKVIISHRSGETEDSFIADFAYGCGADFIKTGSMSRSERLSKYNRLLEIENQLG